MKLQAIMALSGLIAASASAGAWGCEAKAMTLGAVFQSPRAIQEAVLSQAYFDLSQGLGDGTPDCSRFPRFDRPAPTDPGANRRAINEEITRLYALRDEISAKTEAFARQTHLSDARGSAQAVDRLKRLRAGLRMLRVVNGGLHSKTFLYNEPSLQGEMLDFLLLASAAVDFHYDEATGAHGLAFNGRISAMIDDLGRLFSERCAGSRPNIMEGSLCYGWTQPPQSVSR